MIIYTKINPRTNLLQLFGPRWNPNIPRFAANLGFTPLEPVKASADSQPTTASTSNKVQNLAASEVRNFYRRNLFS